MPEVDEVKTEEKQPSVEERLARLEGEHNALLEILDRHGINLPAMAADSQGARGSATKVRKLRAGPK